MIGSPCYVVLYRSYLHRRSGTIPSVYKNIQALIVHVMLSPWPDIFSIFKECSSPSFLLNNTVTHGRPLRSMSLFTFLDAGPLHAWLSFGNDIISIYYLNFDLTTGSLTCFGNWVTHRGASYPGVGDLMRYPASSNSCLSRRHESFLGL